jgi:hypothetical protein
MHGEAWLGFAADGDFITLQPDALSTMFGKFRTRLGEGYYQRSQEAIKCRNADAWLAACAMVGAAVESIRLRHLQHRLHYDHHVDPARLDLLFLPMWFVIPNLSITFLVAWGLLGDWQWALSLILGAMLGLIHYEWVQYSAQASEFLPAWLTKAMHEKAAAIRQRGAAFCS